MKTNKTQWIYLYAGYYELWISDKVLTKPLTLISRHKTIEAAERAAERFDSDAYLAYDKDIAHLSDYAVEDNENEHNNNVHDFSQYVAA